MKDNEFLLNTQTKIEDALRRKMENDTAGEDEKPAGNVASSPMTRRAHLFGGNKKNDSSSCSDEVDDDDENKNGGCVGWILQKGEQVAASQAEGMILAVFLILQVFLLWYWIGEVEIHDRVD